MRPRTASQLPAVYWLRGTPEIFESLDQQGQPFFVGHGGEQTAVGANFAGDGGNVFVEAGRLEVLESFHHEGEIKLLVEAFDIARRV